MKAVFFDLDGTLLDTLPGIRASVNAVLERRGYPPVSLDETRAAVGNGARALMTRVLPENAPLEECLADFRTLYAKNSAEGTLPYDGARECVAALREAGVKTAVITNKPHEATVNVLDAFFGAGAFDFVAGDSGDFPVKPDPSLARYAALTLRVSPAEVLFVGDGETDVLTAKKAGMRPLAVLWGYRTRDVLYAAGARDFARSFADVLRSL